MEIQEKWKQKNGQYKCPYCNKEYCKKGIGTHLWFRHGLGINHKPGLGPAWNKGIPMSLTQKRKISESSKGRILSDDTRKKISKSLKGRSGGIRKGGGRGKSGWYKNYWCDSSWELAFVIYNLDHNIKFTRNNKGFKYIFESNEYKYYPDFIMEDASYIEIKGWIDSKNKAKHAQFLGKLKIIDKEKIKLYVAYAIDKHGKNFIKLYDRRVA